MTINLPNLLTILRLLAAPGIAMCFLWLPRPFADGCALALFALASLTDWFDGYLARSLNMVSKLGTMLDPIADKAMVLISLAVLVHYSSLGTAILLPATFIFFREVFVSGLREFLGDTAGLLKVTKLAKWKTTAQMVSIVVLLGQGLAERYLGEAIFGLDNDSVRAILDGSATDHSGLRLLISVSDWSGIAGVALIWMAAVLTLVSGADYFLKARPYLRDAP